MSDTYYRERAARRNRIIILVAVLVVMVICAYFGVVALFRDSCTTSFDRQPEDVIRSYISYITTGDRDGVINCWEHKTYYELDAGCSDICVTRILGTDFQIKDISLNDPVTTEDGRANMTANVTIKCSGDETEYQGQILLDGISSDVPWRHWKIIESTVGGNVAEPWCN